MNQSYPPYPRELVQGEWNLAPANLLPALRNAFPNNPPKLRCFQGEVTVVLQATAQGGLPNKAGVDAVIAGAKAAFDPLPEAKAARIKEIRDNTDALIAQGAVWNGVTYMSTEEGRFDVLGVFTVGVLAATPGFFPTKISSTDGDTETEFADAAAYAPFFAQMMGTYKHWKDSSQVLRQQVLDATTVAEVDAITDDRAWPWAP